MRCFRPSPRSSYALNRHRIRYALHGEPGRPLVTFANGLTQNADLWLKYSKKLTERGYRVLAYDMLGQGESTRPVLETKLTDHADLLLALLDHVKAPHTH